MTKQAPSKKSKPAPYIRISRRNLFEWLAAFFLVCGFMFVIGVLVGRSTAPVFDVDRIENSLAGLQESVLQKKEDFEKTLKECLPRIEEINVFEKLKEKDKTPKVYQQFVPPVKTPRYGKSAPLTEPADETQTAQVSAPMKSVGIPAPAQALEPVEPSNAAPGKDIPESPKKPPGPEYAIQVAATRDSNKAKNIADRFREKGYPAYCQASNVKGEQWFRIRIGPYPDRATVEKDRIRLMKAGVDSIVFVLEP
jgi:cell division septation protein DedD